MPLQILEQEELTLTFSDSELGTKRVSLLDVQYFKLQNKNLIGLKITIKNIRNFKCS